MTTDLPSLNHERAEMLPHRVPPESWLNSDRPLPEIMNAIDKRKVSILIEKSNYRLTVYYDRIPVKSYPVVFGGNPVGDKQKEGDLRTPEGFFKIRDLYPHDTWSKFIWIDYPNQESWKKYRQAQREGLIQQGDRIGGEVGIHGVPQNQDYLIDQGQNWTLGCISLKNNDIDEIYQVLQKDNWIEIVP